MEARFRVAIGVALLTASVAAQNAYAPPKTPWGDPDIRGTYTSDNSIGVPLERPPQYGDRARLTDAEFANRDKANAEQLAKDNAEEPEVPFEKDAAANNSPRHWLERGVTPSKATSLVVDPPNGRIPALTAQGLAHQFAVRARLLRGDTDSAEAHSNYDRCITRGVTGSILPVIYGNGTQILQGPGYVVIRNEMVHEARLIPLNSRAPRLNSRIHLYMGDPRGHWEGNTLVVDSTNFTDRTAFGPNGNGAVHSTDLHLVERFTKTAPGTIRYEFTVDDPTTYARPWTVALDLNTKPGYQIYEYACHEGNYAMRDMLSAARAADREAAAKK